MLFRTAVKLDTNKIQIGYKDKLCLMGSCFSDHIGMKLDRARFKLLNNPAGIVFNPVSLTRHLEYMLDKRKLKIGDWQYRDALWHHFDFHGKFSQKDKAEAHENLQKKLMEAGAFIRSATHLFITLGTAQVFLRESTGEVVANNHKFPIQEFRAKRLTVEEIKQAFSQVFDDLFRLNPAINIIFTVSPVRYTREGLEENQRSKAALILAIDSLQDGHRIHYFPSYEMFMDDLRDYRYYGDDLIHPGSQGVSYVWEQFVAYYFDDSTLAIMQEIDQLQRSIAHRPIHRDSQNHLNFRKKLLEKAILIQEKHPDIDLSPELAKLQSDARS
jgi:hypothetical protein